MKNDILKNLSISDIVALKSEINKKISSLEQARSLKVEFNEKYLFELHSKCNKLENHLNQIINVL